MQSVHVLNSKMLPSGLESKSELALQPVSGNVNNPLKADDPKKIRTLMGQGMSPDKLTFREVQ